MRNEEINILGLNSQILKTFFKNKLVLEIGIGILWGFILKFSFIN